MENARNGKYNEWKLQEMEDCKLQGMDTARNENTTSKNCKKFKIQGVEIARSGKCKEWKMQGNGAAAAQKRSVKSQRL